MQPSKENIITSLVAGHRKENFKNVSLDRQETSAALDRIVALEDSLKALADRPMPSKGFVELATELEAALAKATLLQKLYDQTLGELAALKLTVQAPPPSPRIKVVDWASQLEHIAAQMRFTASDKPNTAAQIVDETDAKVKRVPTEVLRQQPQFGMFKGLDNDQVIKE